MADMLKTLAESFQKLEPLVDQRRSDIINDKTRGLSILSLRNKLLCAYNICLLKIFSLKLEGKSIENNQIIIESIKLRVVLDKIEPLVKKIGPTISNCLNEETSKNPQAKANTEIDPLSLKPNLVGFLSTKENDTIPKEKHKTSKYVKEIPDKAKNSSDIYQVDKSQPVPYPHEKLESSTKKKSAMDRERRRLVQSSVFESLKDDMRSASGLPEKKHGHLKSLDHQKMKEIKRIMDKEDYELKNFVRLPITKKEKKKRKELLSIVNNDIGKELLKESQDFERMKCFASSETTQKGEKRKPKHKKAKKGKKAKRKKR